MAHGAIPVDIHFVPDSIKD